MKKIVIIQNIIPHYRIALYDELSKYYDIVAGELHSVWSGTKSSNDAFNDTLREWKDL